MSSVMSSRTARPDNTPDAESRRIIPVFPMEQVVLFPRQELSLDIFEPRYKQMVEDCMLHDSLFGVCLTGPGSIRGWEAPMSTGTLTKIMQCRNAELDATRFGIDTLSRNRFRILDIIPPAIDRPPDYDPLSLEGQSRFQDMYDKSGDGRMYIRARVEMRPEIDQSIPQDTWQSLIESWKAKVTRRASEPVEPASLEQILRHYYLATDSPTPDYVYSLAALGAEAPQELQPVLEADSLDELVQRTMHIMEVERE